MAENGSYKTAFWVMTTIATVGLVLLGSAMISNDRLRASEDLRIENNARLEIGSVKDCFYKIDRRLARIEMKLGVEEK